MIGLTENPEALRKWLVAGPELANMVDTFEKEVLFFGKDESLSSEDSSSRHHSDTAANKGKFAQDLKSLVTTINSMGNPFLEQTLDLYNIDTKNIASPEVVETMFNIEIYGEEQYMAFCNERFQKIP